MGVLWKWHRVAVVVNVAVSHGWNRALIVHNLELCFATPATHKNTSTKRHVHRTVGAVSACVA